MMTKLYSQNGTTYLASAELKKKVGCIDLKGNEVVPVIYDDIGFWGNNLIPVNIGARKIDYSKKGGKWGFCNSKGNLVIPTKFDKAESFYEGISAVQIGRKWGFIDTLGNMIIKPTFDEIRFFREGLCAVSKNKKWGFINSKGAIVIELEYGGADYFKNGLATVFVGVLATDENEESIGKYCLINKKGEKIIEPIYEAIWNFVEGLAKVEIKNPSDEYSTKKGFINSKGEIIAPLIYDRAEDFNDGLAVVGLVTPTKDLFSFGDNYLYGYVNNSGKEIIKIQYNSANKFVHGKAIVSEGNQRRMGFVNIDSKDNSIINHEDWAKYALIDKNGRYLLNFDWRQLSVIDSNHYIAQRSKFIGDGVIDLKGNIVIPFNYTNLRFIGHNLFSADDGGGDYGEAQVIDMDNNILIKTKKFALPNTKYEFGLLHVRTNRLSKSGFVDLKGNWVIKDKYEMVGDFTSTNPDDK